MNNSRLTPQSQANIQVLDQIDDFFNKFHIGTLLDRCGIRKRHGYSVRSLTKAIFTLPFIGKNFFRGIVINHNADVGKDAAYDLLKVCTYNWRRFLLTIGVRLHCIFHRLTSDLRESVPSLMIAPMIGLVPKKWNFSARLRSQLGPLSERLSIAYHMLV